MDEMMTRAEASSVAMQLAHEFGRMLKCFQVGLSLTPEQAAAKAREAPADYAARVLERPADQISWSDLHFLAEKDPEEFCRVWQAIKQAALDELRCGDRAARAVEPPDSTAWQRAQFLAIRADLCDGLQPTTGLERQLIDTMAQSLSLYFHWLNVHMLRASRERVSDKELREEVQWQPPRIKDAEAVDQAALLADRHNKTFLRTLRAFRDLRRFSPSIVINNANQVNVGGQQVNQQAAG
jgi:hypothetical protein